MRLTDSDPEDKKDNSVSTSPPAFLTQANKYIKKAWQDSQEGTALIREMDKYGITLTQYNEAIDLSKQIHKQMDNLRNLVEKTTPFPKIVTSNRRQSVSKPQFIPKIEYIIQQIEDELYPLLEDEDPQCQDIQEKFEELEQYLAKLYPLLEVDPLPAHVGNMKPINPLSQEPKKPIFNNHDSNSASDQSPSPLTLALREQLIELLMKVSSAGNYSGRSSLLSGIPGTDTLNRDENSKRHDLELIIDQLNDRGKPLSGAWPLLLLIDNALPYLASYQIGQKLRDVQQALAKAYEAM